MRISYELASAHLADAVAALFEADPRVRSVGIGKSDDEYVYRAVRNQELIMPMGGRLAPPSRIHDIQVNFVDTSGEIEALVLVDDTVSTAPLVASPLDEVKRQRPLFSGLQIQNTDYDERERAMGHLAIGKINVGTIGCFVKLPDGRTLLLSNNHVIAGHNSGRRSADRIAQPSTIDGSGHVAVLHDFLDILFSPPGALPRSGNTVLNTVDAGIAALADGINYRQGYLPSHGLPVPCGIAEAKDGDRVFKVGRTTGLTWGTVVGVATTVGPVSFPDGHAWFRDAIEFEGEGGVPFSAPGDSGSAVVRESGEIVALLYAGNGQSTYACPIQAVLAELGCSLA